VLYFERPLFLYSGTGFHYFAYKGTNGHNSGTLFHYFAYKGTNGHNSGTGFRYIAWKGANGHNRLPHKQTYGQSLSYFYKLRI
jgi:hypothetical protein